MRNLLNKNCNTTAMNFTTYPLPGSLWNRWYISFYFWRRIYILFGFLKQISVNRWQYKMVNKMNITTLRRYICLFDKLSMVPIWMAPSFPGFRPVSLFTDPSQTNADFPDVLTMKSFTFVELLTIFIMNDDVKSSRKNWSFQPEGRNISLGSSPPGRFSVHSLVGLDINEMVCLEDKFRLYCPDHF